MAFWAFAFCKKDISGLLFKKHGKKREELGTII